MSTVTFGKRNRYRFTAGGTLKQWQPSGGAAVYAVTYKPDAVNRPKAHSVVYFGEATDLVKQSDTIRKDLHAWWDENGGTDRELFIFIHEIVGSSQYERANVHHQLVMEYDPVGNN
jgi:hypothetical protein